MTPAEKLEKIKTLIAEGKIVDFCTATKVTRFDAKVMNRFEKAGIEPIIAKDDGLYIIAGKKYEFAGFCAIKVWAAK